MQFNIEFMSLPFKREFFIQLDLDQVRRHFLQICGHFILLVVHIHLQLQDLNLQFPHTMKGFSCSYTIRTSHLQALLIITSNFSIWESGFSFLQRTHSPFLIYSLSHALQKMTVSNDSININSNCTHTHIQTRTFQASQLSWLQLSWLQLSWLQLSWLQQIGLLPLSSPLLSQAILCKLVRRQV